MKKDAKAEGIRYWWDKAVESLDAAHRDLTQKLAALENKYAAQWPVKEGIVWLGEWSQNIPQTM